MRILVDMDGILVDLLARWLEIYNAETGESVTKADIVTWDARDHVADPEKLMSILKRPAFFYDLPALPGALEGFRALQMQGHEVIVCSTPLSGDCARAKYKWCEEHLGLHHSAVTLTHQKSWLAGSCDVLIDDKPSTIVGWWEQDKKAVTIAYPYNAQVAEQCHFRAHCYQDTEKAWGEIVEVLR